MQNKYTIKIHQRALRDLDSIYQYIYEQKKDVDIVTVQHG
jgi:plasmid stabilization system protein ParE